MKKNILIFLCMLAIMICVMIPAFAAEDVAINSENFPDAAFRSYISQSFDGDKDGILSDYERSNVKMIHIVNAGVEDLTGIALFPELLSINCAENQLTSIDVSRNLKLESLDCSRNQLTQLDVRQNPVLGSLMCYNNQLTALDLSHNPELTYLNCGDNRLEQLNVSKNTKLKILYCKNNHLTSLELTKNTALEGVDAAGNRGAFGYGAGRTFDLTTLVGGFDVSKAGSWAGGTVSGNILTVDENVAEVTYTYDCGYGEALTFTLLPEMMIVEELFPDWSFRAILKDRFDTDQNERLSYEELQAATSLYVGNLSYLHSIEGIEYLPQLQSLDCSGLKLTELDVSKNPKLTYLDCSNNKLTRLDLSNNPVLGTLNCNNNYLSELDLSHNPEIWDLSCDDNQLPELDLTGLPELQELNCENNRLSVLVVSSNKHLVSLKCGNNRLGWLDLSKNEHIRGLSCQGNYYTVTLGADRTFDLDTLHRSFDVYGISDLSGGSVSGHILTMDEGVMTVAYLYDCGNGTSVTFYMHVHGEATHYAAEPSDCENGFDGRKEHYRCLCGDTFADAACTQLMSKRDRVIPWAHSGGHADCQTSPRCEACGKAYGDADPNAHVFFDDGWYQTDTTHYHLCFLCDYRNEYEHVYDSGCDMDCNDCGMPREAEHENAWQMNDFSHWEACVHCGEKGDEYSHEIPNNSDECTVCGFEWTEEPEEPASKLSPAIVVVIVLAVIGGMAAVILFRKKKQEK